ncbi:hypothetical protein SEVIR_4G062901v4 [Setaria viridis]
MGLPLTSLSSGVPSCCVPGIASGSLVTSPSAAPGCHRGVGAVLASRQPRVVIAVVGSAVLSSPSAALWRRHCVGAVLVVPAALVVSSAAVAPSCHPRHRGGILSSLAQRRRRTS